MSENSSPTRRRRSDSFGDEQLSSKKRAETSPKEASVKRRRYIFQMRTHRSALQGPTESTPLPGRQKLKNPRLTELQEEHDALNETLGISFTGNEKLDSPFFDKTKSTSYYHSCFEVVELLGSGCFAAVYKCRQKEDGKLYAIKEIKEPFNSFERRDALAKEVRMLECLPPHPNIVGFKRAWQEGQKLFIQTELCQGDLAKFLKNLVQAASINEEIPYLQPHLIPEDLCWSVMIDIMQAARHLHRHGVVHLDIKPENVFTGIEDGRFKLGDFGIAFNFIDGNKSKAIEGDGRYAAPETFNLTSYTPKADSYSIGATVLQIAMGILHPRHARYQDTWADLKLHPECWKTNFAEEMSGKSDELWETLMWLLASKPQERPSPEELLENPDMQLRVSEREKQLARNRFKYKVNSVFNSVLQLLAILCPRHLVSKLRPLMRRGPHTPVHKAPALSMPSTPTVSFIDHRSRESLRSSSTPSRVHNPSIGVDEESLSGRVNLTERFTDMDESGDASEDSSAEGPDAV